MDWPYGKPFQFGVALSAEEIIKAILQEVLEGEQEETAQVVEGSIAPVIDDPAHLLPGECEECGGPCRWEFPGKYEDEEQSE